MAWRISFSKKLVELWKRSNGDDKRELLECVSLNRTVSDVSLFLEKRKPFGYLAERPFFKDGRGGRIRTGDPLLPKQAR